MAGRRRRIIKRMAPACGKHYLRASVLICMSMKTFSEPVRRVLTLPNSYLKDYPDWYEAAEPETASSGSAADGFAHGDEFFKCPSLDIGTGQIEGEKEAAEEAAKERPAKEEVSFS